MTTRSRICLSLAAALTGFVATAGCAGSPSSSATTTGDGSPVAPVASVAPAAKLDSPDIEGLFDVGGHRLYLACTGDGPVTVVYVHGWVDNTSYVPHNSATAIRDLLADDYRVCLYDRRNVGSSDTVDAVQSPADMQHDMESVLAAGGVKPPYILMAASFGGLVASQYLAAHPDDVVGMVLIDTMFPDELRLDPFIAREYRFGYYRKDDKCCSVERIAQYDLVKGLQRSIGREPHIPVIYLASQQQPRTDNPFGSPKYDARILDALAAYVDRFSPGILRWVDAPHFMEPVVPEVIADAVREVDALASD
jgi:pimeloyl-ACP methyl ester carboxylesterase